jgi:hypothetical protein
MNLQCLKIKIKITGLWFDYLQIIKLRSVLSCGCGAPLSRACATLCVTV